MSEGYGTYLPGPYRHNRKTPRFRWSSQHIPLRELYSTLDVVGVISTPKAREATPPQEILPDAHLRWGDESDFEEVDLFRYKARRPGARLGDDDNEEPPERERLNFTVEGVSWTDFRVEHPDDEEQYAIVRQITSIALRAPDGAQWLFRMSNVQQPGTAEGSGQTPTAPPALDEIP